MASVGRSPVASTHGIVYLLIGFAVLQFTTAAPTRVEVTAADHPLNVEISEYKSANQLQKLPELKETENVENPVAAAGPKNESTPDHINKPPLTSSIPRKSSGMSSASWYAHPWANIPPPAMLNMKESDRNREKEKMMFMEQEPANEFLQQEPPLLIEGPAGSDQLFSDSMMKEWLDSVLSRQWAFPAAPVFDEEPSTLAAIDVSPLAIIKAMTDYLLLTGDMRGLESTIADLVALRAITTEEADFYQLVLEYENIQRQGELNKYFRKNILLNFLSLPKNLGFAEYESYDEPLPYLRNPDFNALTLALKSKSVSGTVPETNNEGRQEKPAASGLLKGLEVEGNSNEPKEPLTSKVEFLTEVEQGDGNSRGGKPNPELEKELDYLLGDEGQTAASKSGKTKVVKIKTNTTPKQNKPKSDVRLTKTLPLKSPKKKPPAILKTSKPEVKHDQPDISSTV